MNAPGSPRHLGIAGRIAAAFIGSRLTPLFIIASVLLGVGAVLLLPREEEPQIVVPMVDVFVQMPGASAKEVENRVTRPMEKLLWEIPGVEYVYSTTSPGQSMAIVRFKVGEDEEKSIVRLNQKMSANFDLIPPGATHPLVKPRSIDDVPILALTLSSARHDPFDLRRIAAQLDDQIKTVPDVSEVRIIGGQRRQVRVLLDPARMAARGVAPAALVGTLGAGEPPAPVGKLRRREPGVPRRDRRVPAQRRGRGQRGGGRRRRAARLPSRRGADPGRPGGSPPTTSSSARGRRRTRRDPACVSPR